MTLDAKTIGSRACISARASLLAIPGGDSTYEGLAWSGWNCLDRSGVNIARGGVTGRARPLPSDVSISLVSLSNGGDNIPCGCDGSCGGGGVNSVSFRGGISVIEV